MPELQPPQPGASRDILVGVALILLPVISLGRVCGNGFINFDDDVYVTNNAHVLSGLSGENLVWAITSTDALNWHPLTWMSLQLDAQIYGKAPWGYHLTNLLLHTANTLLLFLALRGMTGALWRSALVAALFAIHPLHVESVAWVAERKDVLSGLFWMLGLLAYGRYVRRPALPRYLAVAAALALGLMAKPMLVTFPFALLLLDYWPLRRLHLGEPAATGNAEIEVDHAAAAPSSLRLVLFEKVPLLVLSAGSAVMTLFAQQSGGSVIPLSVLSLPLRLANTVVCYARYLGMMLWPTGLAPFYPHPQDSLPVSQVAAASILLASLSVLVLVWVRRRPYFFVGWLWYLGTLVPVSGLVQVGEQALADRYTYIPLIGLFFIVAWGAGDLVAHRPALRIPVISAAVGSVLVCAWLAWLQAGLWHDSRSLWEYALRVTPDNALARNNLGNALVEDDSALDVAEQHLLAALRLRPGYECPYINLALVFDKQGRRAEAIYCYTKALAAFPDWIPGRLGLGMALLKQGRTNEGIEQFREAILRKADSADAYYHLAVALARQEKYQEALTYGRECVRLAPHVAKYRVTLASLLSHTGAQEEAQEQYRLAKALGGDTKP